MSNPNRKAKLELLLIALVAIIFAAIELYIDTFERFLVWATANESLLVTEIVTLTIILTVGLSIYAWRRWHEAILLEYDKMQLQQTISVEQDANQRIRSYADAITRGQEEERMRLARELHDDTIQRLIFLNQRVELAAFDHANMPVADELIEMQEVVEGTIDHVRQFIHELRPTYLDELGMVATLGMLAKETRERSDLLVEFEVKGKEQRLSEPIELALYRIAQASLSNVLQHADAMAVQMTLFFRPKKVTLTIEDDGIGFEQMTETELARNGHFGLIGMHERATLLGADFSIRPKRSQGTIVTVEVKI